METYTQIVWSMDRIYSSQEDYSCRQTITITQKWEPKTTHESNYITETML